MIWIVSASEELAFKQHGVVFCPMIKSIDSELGGILLIWKF